MFLPLIAFSSQPRVRAESNAWSQLGALRRKFSRDASARYADDSPALVINAFDDMADLRVYSSSALSVWEDPTRSRLAD